MQATISKAPTSVDEDIAGLEVTVHDGRVGLLHCLHAPSHIQGHLQACCQGPPRCRSAASVASSSGNQSHQVLPGHIEPSGACS